MTPSRPTLVALSAALLCSACMDDRRSLTLAVSPEEPAPSIAETIHAEFADEQMSIDVRESADLSEIFALVQSRTVDLGVVEEPDHPIPGIATVAPLYPSVLHILHNKDIEPNDFVDLLQQADIYAGGAGGAAQRLLTQLAADFGVRADEYRVLDNPWTVDPDVYFIFGGLLTDDAIRQLSGYRFFSFADADEVDGGSIVDAIALKNHRLKPFLLPRNTYYAFNHEPILTLSNRTVMIAHEEFPSDIALEIAAHLFNYPQEFSLDYPLVTEELNTDLNAVELAFPLHSGTRRFLDRDKPGFVERYVDVIALLLSVILAGASGLFALVRYRKQIKKDRVDTFYTRIIALRSKAELTTEHGELQSFRKESISVQQEVLQLLVDERISADSALLAFLSLSNQVITELDHRIGHDI